MLRNETKSRRVKAALERSVCIIDSKHKELDENKIESTTLFKNEPVNFGIDKNYEENEEFDDDKMYDDTPVISANTDVKIEYRKKLLDIPYDLLPCPQKLTLSDNSISPPTQDEVKYYKTSSSVRFSTSFKLSLLVYAFSIIL